MKLKTFTIAKIFMSLKKREKMGGICCICETNVHPSDVYSKLRNVDLPKEPFSTLGINEYCSLFKFLNPLDCQPICIDIPMETWQEIDRVFGLYCKTNNIGSCNLATTTTTNLDNRSRSTNMNIYEILMFREAAETLFKCRNQKIQTFVQEINLALVSHERSFVHIFPTAKCNTKTYNEGLRQCVDVLEIVARCYYEYQNNNNAILNNNNVLSTNNKIQYYLIMTKWIPQKTNNNPMLYRCLIETGLVSSVVPLQSRSKANIDNNDVYSINDYNIIPGIVREDLDAFIHNKLMGPLYFLQLQHVPKLNVDIFIDSTSIDETSNANCCELFDIFI